MSILGRLRGRGTERAARAPRPNGAARGEAGGRIEVETFEYVRVGDTALARVGGVLSPGAGSPSDFTLEVSVLGEGSEALRALVEAAPGSQDRWRAAFATRLELVEHPAATFALLTGGGRIALDPPLLRELHSAPASDGGLDVLEGRVREAEAGLGWIQDQLAQERDRRRALEQEVEALRAELEQSQQHAAEAEARHAEVRYELGLVRTGSGSTISQLEAALESARALASLAAAEPGARPRPEPALGAAACSECRASGECPSCGGKGRRRGKLCRDCEGGGRCAACDGTGYVWDDEDEEKPTA